MSGAPFIFKSTSVIVVVIGTYVPYLEVMCCRAYSSAHVKVT